MDVYNLREHMIQEIFRRVPCVTPERFLFCTITSGLRRTQVVQRESRVNGRCVKSISEQRIVTVPPEHWHNNPFYFPGPVGAADHRTQLQQGRQFVPKPEAAQGASWCTHIDVLDARPGKSFPCLPGRGMPMSSLLRE